MDKLSSLKTAKILRHPLLRQLARFGLTGGTASLTHLLVVVLLVEVLKLHPLRANIIGYFSGFIFSYTGHRYWTFADTTQSIKFTLPSFLFIACINFVLNQSLFYFFFTKLHIDYPIALVMTISIIATFTFLLGKHWVFKK